MLYQVGFTLVCRGALIGAMKIRHEKSSEAGLGRYFVSEDGGRLGESGERAAGGAVLRVPLKDTQRALVHLHIREKLRPAFRAL